MSEINKVTVLICGQEYTLSGDMPREYIMKLADKVDEKMTEISGGNTQTLSKTAVLAAMLISDEYYREKERADKLAVDNAGLEKQSANYENLWEEAKSSFAAYKEEQEGNVNGGKAGGPAVCPNCGSTNCRYSRDKYPMVHCMCCGCDFWD